MRVPYSCRRLMGVFPGLEASICSRLRTGLHPTVRREGVRGGGRGDMGCGVGTGGWGHRGGYREGSMGTECGEKGRGTQGWDVGR